MTLFAILICLLLQRFLNLSPEGTYKIRNHYFNLVSQVFKKWGVKNDLVIVLLILACVFVLIGSLNLLLNNIWFNSLKFIFQVFVLFCCLDGRDLKLQLEDSLKADQKEDQITYQLFSRSQQYVFSVLFWYIIVGPVGAAIYAATRLLTQNHSAELTATAEKIIEWLDWIPARINGLTYALVGHFSKAFAFWRKHLTESSFSQKFAILTGLAALELDENEITFTTWEENQKTVELIQRAVVLWILLISLFTLVAWIA